MRDAATGQGAPVCVVRCTLLDSFAVMWESGEWDCGQDEMEDRHVCCGRTCVEFLQLIQVKVSCNVRRKYQERF